jgi:integrase
MALTDTRLRNIKPTGERFELPDRGGLVLRVSQRGVMTWAVMLRVHGAGERAGVRVNRLSSRKQRLTLGEYPTISLAEAREKAATVKRLARAGTNPTELRAQPPAPPTVAQLVERYVHEHLGRNLKVGVNVEKLLRRHVVPRWGQRELTSLTRGDLIDLLEAIRCPQPTVITGQWGTESLVVRGGAGSAAEVRKWVRAMFQFGVEIQLLTENPFADIRNRDRQTRRDRVLNMEELRAVWRAAGRMGYPWGPYLQLIMLSGDRRGEWANARVEWLDPDRTRLEIPAAHYKTGKPQVVPLSNQAQALVRSLPVPELGHRRRAPRIRVQQSENTAGPANKRGLWRPYPPLGRSRSPPVDGHSHGADRDRASHYRGLLGAFA